MASSQIIASWQGKATIFLDVLVWDCKPSLHFHIMDWWSSFLQAQACKKGDCPALGVSDYGDIKAVIFNACWLQATLKQKHILAALLAAVSVLFRQTNAVWACFLLLVNSLSQASLDQSFLSIRWLSHELISNVAWLLPIKWEDTVPSSILSKNCLDRLQCFSSSRHRRYCKTEMPESLSSWSCFCSSVGG